MNLFRQRIEEKKKILGSLVSLTDPCLCELMGHVGFDAVWIDTEHTYMSQKDVLCHLNAARAAGIASLVRLPQNDLTATKQILEMGPDAILFPMVRSAAEARELIDMTLYPPRGSRGFGPIRAIRYGADDAKDYTARTSLELCRLMQIESVSMIDELEEIAQSPYVDGFLFGPNDLSGSVGEMLNVFGEATLAQVRRAVAILKKHGKYFGIACGADPETLARWAAFEPDMLFAGGDWGFLYSAGRQTLSALQHVMHPQN